MTTNFLIALAELLRECPMCHKVTMNETSKLEIGSNKVVRTCQCGYKIELDIKEGNEVPNKKILNEDIHNTDKPENNRKEEQNNGSNNS